MSRTTILILAVVAIPAVRQARAASVEEYYRAFAEQLYENSVLAQQCSGDPADESNALLIYSPQCGASVPALVEKFINKALQSAAGNEQVGAARGLWLGLNQLSSDTRAADTSAYHQMRIPIDSHQEYVLSGALSPAPPNGVGGFLEDVMLVDSTSITGSHVLFWARATTFWNANGTPGFKVVRYLPWP